MADPRDKYPQNAPGKYYVDRQCTDCDLCRTEAPDVFSRHENGHSYVARQPVTEESARKTEYAIECCPVQAIGSDGGEKGQDEAA